MENRFDDDAYCEGLQDAHDTRKAAQVTEYTKTVRTTVQFTANDLRLLALSRAGVAGGKSLPDNAKIYVYCEPGVMVDVGPQDDQSVIVEIEW